MSHTPAMNKEEFSDFDHFNLLTIYIKKHIRVFFLLISMMVLNVVTAMISPLILNYIIEVVERNLRGPYQSIEIIPLVIGYVGFAMLSWFFSVFMFIAVAKLTSRFIRDLRIDAYGRLIENNISFFDEQKSGDLTSRMVNDTKELAESANSIAAVFVSIFRIILVIAVFFYFSPIIATAALTVLPVTLLISFVLGRYERRISKIWRQRFGEVNSRFQEIMSKISISKAFNREKENFERFRVINEETYKASVKRGFAIFLFWPITDLLKHGLTILILAVGTWQVDQGMPIATLVLFLVLMNYYYWPLITIASNFHRFQGALASLERITKIAYDPVKKEDYIDGIVKDNFDGKIEFDQVNFSYEEGDPILRDISFSIQPGDRVALVGHTGAGKSTIASLLMNFYKINEGEIRIDNQSLYDYQLKSYRSRVSMVSQKVLLFKGTVRENLIISSKNITDDQIWEVLERVQAREFIELLPGGLDAEVKENGKNLSAGQKQMISFARALLAEPDIIILDEASSAVDLYTEAKITDGIDILLSERTSISIAHRLTTIMKSDKIIVLEAGKVEEIGNHQQLLELDGKYAEMYHMYLSTQSAKFLEKIKH